MGGLFLLSRRSGGGGGMGGGPGGGPMQFGKSKAKFQMEPNTGITFDDVAGVDEAKQDFMEVRFDPPTPFPLLSLPVLLGRNESSIVQLDPRLSTRA